MPVIIRAVLTGALAGAIGTMPWALLAAANLKFFQSVPWAVPVMALYLWILWRLALMPFYLGVAAIYGTIAYLTNSIWPSAVLHAVGNVFGSIDFFTRGQSEWQASATPRPLIWEGGADASFWISCLAFLIVGAAAVWAYRGLSFTTRFVRVSAT